MSGNQRVGGPYELQAGGVRLNGKGGASYNLGHPKREAVLGASGGHGFTEKPQVSFVEVDVTDNDALDVKALVTMRDKPVTLKVANGKTILLHNAYYAGEGTITTDEGSIGCRFESLQPAEELAS
jgi:hypothetical protein